MPSLFCFSKTEDLILISRHLFTGPLLLFKKKKEKVLCAETAKGSLCHGLCPTEPSTLRLAPFPGPRFRPGPQPSPLRPTIWVRFIPTGTSPPGPPHAWTSAHTPCTARTTLNTSRAFRGEARAMHLQIKATDFYFSNQTYHSPHVRPQEHCHLWSPPPPPPDSALARGCPVRSPLHHCPRVMLSQIPRSNEPESPAGPIHHGFMSAKEAAAGELVIRWGLGVQRSGPWSQDPRGVGSNPSPSTAGRVTLGTTCIHPLCTSPVTLTLGSYMDEMNNDS